MKWKNSLERNSERAVYELCQYSNFSYDNEKKINNESERQKEHDTHTHEKNGA